MLFIFKNERGGGSAASLTWTGSHLWITKRQYFNESYLSNYLLNHPLSPASSFVWINMNKQFDLCISPGFVAKICSKTHVLTNLYTVNLWNSYSLLNLRRFDHFVEQNHKVLTFFPQEQCSVAYFYYPSYVTHSLKLRENAQNVDSRVNDCCF